MLDYLVADYAYSWITLEITGLSRRRVHGAWGLYTTSVSITATPLGIYSVETEDEGARIEGWIRGLSMK
jgi:hypothetical protein